MRTVKINVTQQDIANGCPGDENACPLSLAMTRALGRPVTVYGVQNIPSGLAYHGDFPLPPACTKFIELFDDGLPVRPFTFTVEVPNGR